jgi:hypothetical protein
MKKNIKLLALVLSTFIISACNAKQPETSSVKPPEGAASSPSSSGQAGRKPSVRDHLNLPKFTPEQVHNMGVGFGGSAQKKGDPK